MIFGDTSFVSEGEASSTSVIEGEDWPQMMGEDVTGEGQITSDCEVHAADTADGNDVDAEPASEFEVRDPHLILV